MQPDCVVNFNGCNPGTLADCLTLLIRTRQWIPADDDQLSPDNYLTILNGACPPIKSRLFGARLRRID